MASAAPRSRVEHEGEPTLRAARCDDGAEVWRLVRDSAALELNSCYAYLVFCRDFGHTSVVAELDGKVAGFVLAYRPPREQDVVFVWQIAVDEALRGRGVGGAMLRKLVEQPSCRGVDYLEATVAPSNRASLKLFGSLARRSCVPIEKVGGFRPDEFGGGAHDPEDRYRIGPFSSPANENPRPGGR